MLFNIRSQAGPGSVTTDERCLPPLSALAQMYDDGCRLFADGEKLPKEDALKLVAKLRGEKYTKVK